MPRRRNHELLLAVGRRIRALRLARELTQAQLAEATDLTVEYIGKAEKGIGALSLGNLAAVARALGVALKDLVDTAAPAPAPDVAPAEAKLVRIFRGLNERDQGVLLGVAELLGRGTSA